MSLRSLNVGGFKSFAHDTTLSFPTPITAIVGPNGSGKSNIADAFRFVLGEGSSKNLRGDSSVDVIWNGSASKPRHNRARASVTIDNESGHISLPYSEIEISRVVHRDKSAEYLLNGSGVTKKTLAKALASSGVGPSRYNIIAQGEADRLIHCSPQELALLFEDALGLRALMTEREEIESDLKRSEESLVELSNLRETIEPERIALLKRLEERKTMIGRRDHLTSLIQEYISRKTSEIEEKKSHFESQRNAAYTVLETYSQENEEGDTQKIDYEIEYRSAVEDVKSRLKAASIDFRARERVRDQLDLTRNTLELEIREREGKGGKPGFKPGAVHVSIPRASMNDLEHIVESYRDTQRTDTSTRLIIADRLTDECEQLISSHLIKEIEEPVDTSDLQEKLQSIVNALNEADEAVAESEMLMLQLESEEMEAISLLSSVAEVIRTKAERKHLLESARHDATLADSLLKECEKEAERLAEDCQEYARVCGRVIFDDTDLQFTNTPLEDLKQTIDREYGRIAEYEFGNSVVLEREETDISKRLERLVSESEDIKETLQKLISTLKDIDDQYTKRWKEGVNRVSELFTHHVVTLFGSGTGKVESSFDDKNRRIIKLSVELPSKRVRSILALSGGERTLISLALLFALIMVTPPPFVVLDETDAALDEINSYRYGDLLQDISKHTQLVIITHNREVMERAGTLHGITMGKDGVSRLISLSLAKEGLR